MCFPLLQSFIYWYVIFHIASPQTLNYRAVPSSSFILSLFLGYVAACCRLNLITYLSMTCLLPQLTYSNQPWTLLTVWFSIIPRTASHSGNQNYFQMILSCFNSSQSFRFRHVYLWLKEHKLSVASCPTETWVNLPHNSQLRTA